MKILYGVQGTGHGHITRARVVLPVLREFAEVDVLISGYNFHMDLDGAIQYKKRGISLTYDSNGSVDFLETALNVHPFTFIKDLHSLPLQDYDFVINDFEPVTAWAAQQANMPCVAISHQAAFASNLVPRPERKSLVAEGVLKHFAPFTEAVGSHYQRYDDFIEPPIIRRKIKELNPSSGDHVTVYLPAYDHEFLSTIFQKNKEVEWHIFAPGCEKEYRKSNVWVRPVGKDTFLESIEHCLGVVSSTGFETTSETMFLGKKLLTIPIKNQYEQLCNAAALEPMGAHIVHSIGKEFNQTVSNWLKNGKELTVSEISDEYDLVAKIIAKGQKKRAEIAA
ncbi:MAG: hypothetical protein JJ895_08665 [Balneolaceae bacterium]|nr:hypothetical protein [Balneolaceae bacterium]